MSEREAKRRKIMTAVMREAWKLFKRAAAYTWSTVLKLAWATVRSRIRIHYSKAYGVAVSGTSRQGRLQRLSKHRSEDIILCFVREQDNKFDPNAIRIVASLKGELGGTVGYVKRELAAMIAPTLDVGRQAVVILDRITGTGSKGLYGLNYAYALI